MKSRTMSYVTGIFASCSRTFQGKINKTTASIFEGLDSEAKTRIPGRSALVYRVKFLFRIDSYSVN